MMMQALLLGFAYIVAPGPVTIETVRRASRSTAPASMPCAGSASPWRRNYAPKACA